MINKSHQGGPTFHYSTIRLNSIAAIHISQNNLAPSIERNSAGRSSDNCVNSQRGRDNYLMILGKR